MESLYEIDMTLGTIHKHLLRGPDEKKNNREIFFASSPSRPQKISVPPLLPWKLRVSPIEKHVNSIFTEKSVVIFSSPPLQGKKI